MKKTFKGEVNGKEFENYDEYIVAKDAAINSNNLVSCSERWETCCCDETSEECCCEECSCKNDVEYPDNLRLLFEDCTNSDEAHANNYIEKFNTLGTATVTARSNKIKNIIPTLSIEALNEYLDDVDFMIGILDEDHKSIKELRKETQKNIEAFVADFIDIRNRQFAIEYVKKVYSEFMEIAKNTLKEKIVAADKAASHQANEERLKKACPCEESYCYENPLGSKKECTENITDNLDDKINEFNEILNELGEVIGVNPEEIKSELKDLVKMFGLK